jgi:hypothetical protein
MHIPYRTILQTSTSPTQHKTINNYRTICYSMLSVQNKCIHQSHIRGIVSRQRQTGGRGVDFTMFTDMRISVRLRTPNFNRPVRCTATVANVKIRNGCLGQPHPRKHYAQAPIATSEGRLETAKHCLGEERKAP